MKRSKALKIFWKEIKLMPIVILNQVGWYDTTEKDKEHYYKKRWIDRTYLSEKEEEEAFIFEKKELQNRLERYKNINSTPSSTIICILVSLFIISITLTSLVKHIPLLIFLMIIILMIFSFIYFTIKFTESKKCLNSLIEWDDSFKQCKEKGCRIADVIDVHNKKAQQQIKYNDKELLQLPEMVAIADLCGAFSGSELSRKDICNMISKFFISASGQYSSVDSNYKRYNHLMNDPILLKKSIASIIDKLETIDLNALYK